MSEISLLQPTGHQAIDRILKGIIGFCELLFPGRIRGYYLQGSFANGDATAASDIDLVFVFKHTYESSEEKNQARCVDTYCEWLTGRQLDIIPTTDTELFTSDWMAASTIIFSSVPQPVAIPDSNRGNRPASFAQFLYAGIRV